MSDPRPTGTGEMIACGSQGVDVDGHCVRCGYKVDPQTTEQCPRGFLAPSGESETAEERVPLIAATDQLRDAVDRLVADLEAQESAASATLYVLSTWRDRALAAEAQLAEHRIANDQLTAQVINLTSVNGDLADQVTRLQYHPDEARAARLEEALREITGVTVHSDQAVVIPAAASHMRATAFGLWAQAIAFRALNPEGGEHGD